MYKDKEKLLTVLSLVALALVTIGISYAAFTYIGQGQRENTITTGNLTFVYDESNKSGNGISIDNATPTPDDLGKASVKQGEVFEFSVSASTKGAPIYYEIYTTKQSDSTLPEKIIKTYLTTVQGEEETGVPNTLTNETVNTYNKLGISQVPDQENGRTLYQEMIPEGQDSYSKTFRYRMWISDTATEVDENGVWKYNDKSFTVKVNVYASNEEIGLPIPGETDPNPPILVQGYIPVTYSKEKSSWVKADTSSNWYDYSNQEWANAVTVTEANREIYMNASAGTPISMGDINTMWVWIPRYEYMYTNLGTDYAGGTKEQPGELKVKFIEGTGTTPSDSANYKIHPAFTFGEDELEGLWYAKFETSTTDATCNSSSSEANCNKLMTSLQIKPNVSSWRYANVSNFFNSARNMQLQYASTYGFSKTDSDIHMSKNSEWGAVAYLSQSKYGKYGNPNYTDANKEVAINSNSRYLTGGGTGTSYITNIAQSTTGNITGIYDMSGGSWEYVMGNLNKIIGSSGFSTFPEDKYYDLYNSTDCSTACNGGICYGHALSETAFWYSDYPFSLYASWFMRGGYYNNGVEAGVFASDDNTGVAYDYLSSRLVQTPLK